MASCCFFQCWGAEYPMVSLEVLVVDEFKKPIPGVSVTGYDESATIKIEGRRAEGETGPDGICLLKLRALSGVGVYAKKANSYYDSIVSSRTLGVNSPFKFNPFIYREDMPESDQINPPMKKGVSLKGSATLRKIKKPIPLYAKNLQIDFPARDVWLGYDLEAGDWVPPHGQGKREDMRFLSRPKSAAPPGVSLKESPGSAVLEIQFGEGGGLVRVSEENGYLPASEMKMPHEAPAGGYEQMEVLKIEQKDYEAPDPMGTRAYFFRTRVVREAGKIVSANFGKIPMTISCYPVQKPEPRFGDKKLNQRSFGGVEFIYYFNPTPNDRNLEFDPKQNLFKKENERWNEYNIDAP